MVMHLPQSTDLLLVHRITCLHKYGHRDKNIISAGEGCVLVAPSGL